MGAFFICLTASDLWLLSHYLALTASDILTCGQSDICLSASPVCLRGLKRFGTPFKITFKVEKCR